MWTLPPTVVFAFLQETLQERKQSWIYFILHSITLWTQNEMMSFTLYGSLGPLQILLPFKMMLNSTVRGGLSRTVVRDNYVYSL